MCYSTLPELLLLLTVFWLSLLRLLDYLEPRVEYYTSLQYFKYEPCSEPLHISADWLFLQTGHTRGNTETL